MGNTNDDKILHLQKILDTTRKLDRILISSKDMNSLLKEVCNILVNTRDYLCSGITIFDNEKNIVQFEWEGEHKSVNELKSSLHAGKLPEIYEEAIEKNELKIIEDKGDIHSKEQESGNWITYIFPFKIDNDLQGTLCAAILKKEALHPKERIAFVDIANNLGYKLGQLKLEEENRKNEIRYRKLVDSLSDALFILQDDGIKFANPSLCELSGYSEKELLGSDFTQFIAQDELLRIRKLHEQRKLHKPTKSKYESVGKTKSGVLIPVDVTVTLTDYNDAPAFQVILRDISAYKNVLKELKESEEHYRFLSNSSFEGILIHDNGIILDVNDSLLRLSDYSRDELVGQSLFNIIISEADRKKVAEKTKLKNCAPYVIRVVTKSGKTSFAQIEARDTVYKGKHVRIAAIRDISEKHHLEIQVKETQAHLNRLLNNLPGVAYNCKNNKNWDMNFMSQGCFTLFGYRPDELIQPSSISYEDLILPNDREYVWQTIQKAIENKTPFELEYRVRTKENKEKWVWERGNFITNESEILIEGFITDITKIKQYEDELVAKNILLNKEKNKAKEEQQKYQELFSNSATSMLLLDPESGKIIDANQAACKFYKYSHKQITSLFIDQINTLSMKEIKALLLKAINNEQNIFEFQHRLADGTIRDVESHSGSVVFGEKKLIYSIVHDITSRNAMARSNQMLSKAMEASPVSIVITDCDGKIEYANPFFEVTTGYKREEIFGENPRILKGGNQPEEFYKDLWQTISSGKTWQGEFRNKNKKGERYWEQAIISPIFDKNKKIIQYIAVKEDITEKRKTLKDLQEAKEKAEVSDKLKSSFLANMSHEIRTPMNGILGFTELLKEPDLTGDQQTEFIDIIQSSSERMLSTINDIIDISKIESGLIEVNYQDINLSSLIQQIYVFFKPLMKKKDIEFKVNENNGNSVDLFYTDPDKLNSILNNLIRNAYKFTSAGCIEFGYTSNKRGITFFVNDTGVGIPKDRHKAIFERFVQADIADSRVFEGSGLGLSITKSYTEMLNGTIEFESEVGKGTSFQITIPILTNASSDDINILKKRDQEITTGDLKLKVLIAEDDLVSVELLKLLIHKIASNILVANNGIEAVELAKKNSDIDLILMDVKMPKMDGFTATKEIRKFNSEVKIVAQTAFAHSEDSLKAFEIGCDDFITKPINKHKLLESIKNIFENM